MQKPMKPRKEKKHMKQISIPLFSPAIAPERGPLAAFARVRDLCTRKFLT